MLLRRIKAEYEAALLQVCTRPLAPASAPALFSSALQPRCALALLTRPRPPPPPPRAHPAAAPNTSTTSTHPGRTPALAPRPKMPRFARSFERLRRARRD